MRSSDFDFVRTLVRDEAAIVLEDHKQYLVETRLMPLVRAHGLRSLEELVEAVRSGRQRNLAAEIVDAMTTNETSFFRDEVPWHALRDEVLPDLVQRRRPQRTLRVWSAACSTGQEPYTLLMLLAQNLPEVLDWDLQVLATDISPSVLQKAQEGLYLGVEIDRGLDPALKRRFFRAEGSRWRLDDDLRRRVTFRRMNLAAAWTPLPTFDLIFVRNVLIYFDTATKRQILGRMERQLAPDGYLLLGSGETTLNLDVGLRRQRANRAWFYQHG